MTSFPSSGYLSNAGRTTAEMQQALEDINAAAQQLPGGAAETELTIAAGAVTPTGAAHLVDTESDDPADNLDTIDLTNLPDGSVVTIRAVDPARVVTVRHAQGGAGQILTADGASVVLDAPGKRLWLQRVGTSWVEVERFGFVWPIARGGTGAATLLAAKAALGIRMPRGYFSGFTVALNGGDPDHDLDFGSGAARSDDDAADIAAGAMTKRFDAAFAEGSGNGGMIEGNDQLPTNGTVHIHGIAKADGTADICGSLSLTPTLPTGFVAKRRIASLLTGASANFIGFVQVGDLFRFASSYLDGSTAAVRNIAALALTVPTGIIVFPLLRCTMSKSGTASLGTSILAPGTDSGKQMIVAEGNASFDRQSSIVADIWTDTAGQIYWAVSGADFSSVQVNTHGYYDFRRV